MGLLLQTIQLLRTHKDNPQFVIHELLDKTNYFQLLQDASSPPVIKQ